MLDPKELRRRLLSKLRQIEDGGERMTQRELAARSGQSKMTIQNLRNAIPKQYQANTLIAIAKALGEGADFFFREEPTVERRADRPHLWGDRDGPALDILEVVKTKWDCDTFTLLAVRSESEIEVLACQKGELVYHGPDRRESRKVRG